MATYGVQQRRFGTVGYRTSQPAGSPLMRELAGSGGLYQGGYPSLYGQQGRPGLTLGAYNPEAGSQPAKPKGQATPPRVDQAPAQSGPSQAGGAVTVEPTDADPVLARVKKLYGYVDEQGNFIPGVRVQDARAGAASQRKQLAIDLGDEGLARQFGDDTTAQAARENPFSILAELARSFENRERRETDDFRARNLLQSGTRATALSDLSRDRLQGREMAFRDTRGLLDEIASYLLGVEQDAIDQILAAEQGAYESDVAEGRGAPLVPETPPLLEALIGDPAGQAGSVTDVLLEELLGNVALEDPFRLPGRSRGGSAVRAL